MAAETTGRQASAPSDFSGRYDAKFGIDQLLRIHLTYLWRHRRVFSLDAPTRLTELVQHRKLFDRDPRLPILTDKLEAKRFAGELLGERWITPTLWSGAELPDAPRWPRPFVVKSRHGCNQRRFIRDGAQDWQAVRRAAKLWMRGCYGGWLDEWGYRDVPHGLLVEPMLGDGGTLPIDYKLFVFHGRAEFIQVHLDREGDHRWLVLDRGWNRVSPRSSDPDPPRPASLAAMIAGAETLGRTFDFVRIDLYEIGGAPCFGEMSFYPGSGLDPVEPAELDVAMGALWLAGSPRPYTSAGAWPEALT